REGMEVPGVARNYTAHLFSIQAKCYLGDVVETRVRTTMPQQPLCGVRAGGWQKSAFEILIHPVGMRSGAHSTPVVTLTRPLDSPWRQHGAMVRGESGGWLIVDSRVVMDQAWLHRLLLRAFHRGRDRGGICGKSHFISSASVLYRVGKTPASNMSLRQTA